MVFAIEFSRRAREHLKRLRKRDQRIIVDAVVLQLAHQADQPTPHRKLLKNNVIAPWELRVGDFRVFYDIDRDGRTVVVVAIGRKTHDQLRIGEEEIEL